MSTTILIVIAIVALIVGALVFSGARPKTGPHDMDDPRRPGRAGPDRGRRDDET